MAKNETTSGRSPAGPKRVPLQTVERLSLYRKVLEELHGDGVEQVYSEKLAALAGVTPSQLRRDLASFGSFGNVVRGYNVPQLIQTLSGLLGTDTIQPVALFGAGNFGRTLLAYRGFEERGFHIGVVFDVDPDKVGRVFAGRRCHHVDELEQVLAGTETRLAILACRPQGLQQLVERLAAAGIRSFLNFVPKRVAPPAGTFLEEVDLTAKLEKLSFLGRYAEQPDEPPASAGVLVDPREDDGRPTRTRRPGGGPDMTQPKHILIVDDDRDLTGSMKAFLAARGYDVAVANNGTEGKAALAQRRPDLIVLDIMMDFATEGFNLAYSLKEDPSYRKIPILIVSGFPKELDTQGDKFDFILGRDWPAAGMLEKPIELKQLAAKIAEILAEEAGAATVD